ncbi:hypothetical protein SALBM311S_10986 [Streptomyces alboniger]
MGELAELDAAAGLVLVADVGQRLLDDVVRPDADPARGDHEVGADGWSSMVERSVSASSATAPTR